MTDMQLKGVIDSTLREGEQRAGVCFDYHQKLAIVNQLVELGIDEIEIGVASTRSGELLSLVPKAKEIADKRTKIALWSRCTEQDIEFAHKCKPDTLSLSMPVSEILIREKLGRTHLWVLEKLEHSIRRASEVGFKTISVGLEDATRAEPDFLQRVACLIDKTAATRLRLADTLGIASPGEMSALVRAVKNEVSISVGVHTHNDFGMATANAIAALENGAQYIDATVLGLGERAGNCCLEEIVGYLTLHKMVGRYDVSRLKCLCDLISEIAETPIPLYHPIVGEKIFTCETGLHVQALTINPKTYEPFDPLHPGQNRTLLFGSKTGRKAVEQLLGSAGLHTSAEQIETLVEEVRLLAKRGAAPLLDIELIELAQQKIGTA